MDPVDFIAGSVSGALGQVFGHPMDTVKVRMQTSPGVYNSGLINAVRLICVREGPLALFQGVAAVSMIPRTNIENTAIESDRRGRTVLGYDSTDQIGSVIWQSALHIAIVVCFGFV